MYQLMVNMLFLIVGVETTIIILGAVKMARNLDEEED